ncbi:MAG: hypothetical protein QGG54_04860 [Gammaproteobacteria bacterium]|jgi:hypothetical protein|nr:hypothetical protein [Chromatiales bacterium]MDP6414347.1 hypothetical protein [Gammaproteobacteria bacterium]MDP6674021.1 hypothetical protein [Gammaproteobacteria bacterium]
MERLLRLPCGGWIFSALALSGVAIFAFAIGVLMLPHSAALGERMGEMTCLQLAFTAERASEIVLSFGPEARAAIAALLVPGDVTFAWSYGFLLAGLIGLLTRRLDGAWFRAGAIAIWFPLAASVLDCVEDVFLLSIVTRLNDSPDIVLSPILPALASTAASMKYLALCILTPIFSVAGMAQAFRTDRSIGALVLYAFLLLTVVNMIMRPAQHLPACF